MADPVVGVVVDHLLSEALSLAAERFSLVYNFKNNLESLAEELKWVQSLVADADSKDSLSAPMESWLKRLKTVVFEAEDVLEEYKYELLRQKVPKSKWDKVRNIFFSPMRKLAFRCKMARQIKDMISLLKSVQELGTRSGLTITSTSSEVKLLSPIVLTSPFVNESEIIGRDKDVNIVVDMLLSANYQTNFSVVAIFGMAGQGKTALAQLVFKSPKLVNHFQKKIWVCVSGNFEIVRLLNEMLQAIEHVNHNLTNTQALVEKLQGHLKGNRYLLVLDDVWNDNQEKWDAFERDLREIGGSVGTKVLVTTRSETVASISHASYTHPLSRLSDDDSWNLFKQRAFAEGGPVETQQFMEIGQRMLKKRCGGLPLAVKTLGGLLYFKKDVGEWLRIENSNIWSVDNNSNEVLSSIKLSYNHLASVSLKQCFAYCSIFPKDTRMERGRLIQLWMAQGLLNPPEGSSLEMEDVGNNFFNILLWNGLLQEPEYDKCNNIYCCKMHDVVHDFVLLISRDYCVTRDVGSDFNDVKAVHICLTGSSEGKRIDMSQGIWNFPNARTLYVPSGVIGNNLVKFRRLRSLILSDYGIKQLPDSIGRLKLLKCIDVTETEITILPTSFGKLYNLQTLRMGRVFSRNVFLSTLISLRHIYQKRGAKCVFVGLKYLANLQTLPYLNLSGDENDSCNKIEDIGPLQNLSGKLIINGLEKVKNGGEAQKAKLFGKPKIQHLELLWTDEDAYNRGLNEDEDVLENLGPPSNLKSLKIFGFRGSKFPSWMMRTTNCVLLHSLVSLVLKKCYFCKQLPPLGQLPCLERLKIHELHNVKSIGAEFYGPNAPSGCAFPALKKLIIQEMENLEEWVGIGIEHPSSSSSSSSSMLSSATSFPHLEHLEVYKCDKLVELPFLLECLSSLKSLDISHNQNLAKLSSPLSLPSLERLEISYNTNLLELPYLQNLSSLEHLEISGNEKLVKLPSSLQSLSSLKKLRIEDHENLLELPSLQNLSSLRDLTICGLPQLVSLPSLDSLSSLIDLDMGDGRFSAELLREDDFPRFDFPFLESLTLRRWSRLQSLPHQLSHLSSLRHLKIIGFEELKTLPEWLGNFHSLESLRLVECPNLESMPSKEAMHRLTNLTYLILLSCDRLKERCITGSIPEAHKIAHIPDIWFDGEDIKIKKTDSL